MNPHVFLQNFNEPSCVPRNPKINEFPQDGLAYVSATLNALGRLLLEQRVRVRNFGYVGLPRLFGFVRIAVCLEARLPLAARD